MCRATKLCCFRYLRWFEKSDSRGCDVCGDWKCVKCNGCLCDLTNSEKKIAIAYMATYENLLQELTNESYDFKRHRKVLEQIGAKRDRLIRASVRS
jgi:hypothetical protein